jgi:transposase
LAQEILELYGEQPAYLDYEAITSEVKREQKRLANLEDEIVHLRRTAIHPRYRRLYPSRNLETLKGVGQDGAAVYLSHVGVSERFVNNRSFRGWSGMVPRSDQSGEAESKGTRISKAGPNLVKKYAFINADVARHYDPQLAAIYYDQMVNKGKHHSQAVCACATHLLDRVRVVLNEDRPYELRDVDGTSVSPEQARKIILDRYIVPKKVRQRNSKRARRLREEDRVERKEQRKKGGAAQDR